MNLLLINNVFKRDGQLTTGGVEYHRMVQPHKVLRRHFPEYDLRMTNVLTEEHTEILKQTDLVIFSRLIHKESAELLKKMDIPFGLDLDDYWVLPTNHIAYEDYIKHDIPKATEDSIKWANFVMCTTPILLEKIKPLNPNCFVVENGIDSEDEVWKPNKIQSDRLRFGFTQGNSHFYDIKSISDNVSKCFKDNDFYKKCQVVLCGFYGEDKTWKELTMEQIYELMLTDSHKALRFEKEYLRDLIYFNKVEGDKPYIRKWSVGVDVFGTLYDSFDVCVAPLIKSEFNSCKSELKMLEAGFKDCAVICHHNAPYTLLATDKNSLDLNKYSFRECYKKLLNNENLLLDLKSQLRLDVEKYNLKHLVNKRNEIYKQYK